MKSSAPLSNLHHDLQGMRTVHLKGRRVWSSAKRCKPFIMTSRVTMMLPYMSEGPCKSAHGNKCYLVTFMARALCPN